jgi:hypothetical protein
MASVSWLIIVCDADTWLIEYVIYKLYNVNSHGEKKYRLQLHVVIDTRNYSVFDRIEVLAVAYYIMGK